MQYPFLLNNNNSVNTASMKSVINNSLAPSTDSPDLFNNK